MFSDIGKQTAQDCALKEKKQMRCALWLSQQTSWRQFPDGSSGTGNAKQRTVISLSWIDGYQGLRRSMWLKFVKQPAREKGHAQREKERERSRELRGGGGGGVSLNLWMSTDLYMRRGKLCKVKKKPPESSKLNKSRSPHREGNSSCSHNAEWGHFTMHKTLDRVLKGSKVSSWP